MGVPPGRWSIECERSTVAFAIRHLTVATVHGAFVRFDGGLRADETGLTAAEGTVAAASVRTGDAKRDAALLGPGFLGAAAHPLIRFRIQSVERVDGAADVHGDLTIKGITRPIRLTASSVAVEAEAGTPERARIVASGTLSRSEFGVTGGGLIESAGAIVSDTVKIELDLSVIKPPGVQP